MYILYIYTGADKELTQGGGDKYEFKAAEKSPPQGNRLSNDLNFFLIILILSKIGHF